MDPLASTLQHVRDRIAAAARASGRDPAEVALLAVSKTWPAADVRALAALGQREFAENKAQELDAKAAELTDVPLTWHFVGQLQRNKAGTVVARRAVVHSVDSVRLADALARAGEREQHLVEVFVQVDMAEEPDPGRGGIRVSDAMQLIDHVAAQDALRLRGLMAVAPRGEPAGPAFDRLAALAEEVRAAHPGARELSAGMSGDLEEAVAAGATLVRVGTALFGDRALASR